VPARVLFIGLDSAEATLVERWTVEGKLPGLAALEEDAAAYRLDNCWRTLPTAVWPELTNGRAPEKVALFFPPGQLRTGEDTPRRVGPDEVDPEGFWTIASDAGKRVAAVDLPWTVSPDDLNGIFLGEWCTHDRWFGTTSFPETLADEVRSRHGDYPVHLCDDDYGASLPERERLVRDLLLAVDYEIELCLDLLGREDWDLFACAFGQFQCVGHNLWEFIETHERVSESLRTAVFDVHARVDAGIARLREAAGPGATSVVVISHGMGPLVGGHQLLSDVLVRLGAGSGAGSVANVRSRLPHSVRRTLRTLTPGPLRRRLQKVAGSLPAPLASSETKAASLPADVNGYIRLNLRGREPNGSVSPGADAEAELAAIAEALRELKDPKSGEPIVNEALLAADAFGPECHPDVPDLMVSFRHDLGKLDECVSERVGIVRAPARVVNRSGDHTGEARLWLAGDGLPRSTSTARAHALDVAPTILSLLGVPRPDRLDGHSLL
jgi:predicted AlkP superfamily phosphohydrolase/phosphomutase